MRPVLVAVGIFIVACGTIDKDKENYFKPAHKKRQKDCEGPYGAVPHGTKIRRYNVLVADNSQRCKSEVRVCKNGELSGSFIFPGCTEVAKANP